MIKGIAHLAFCVSNMERSLDFYVGKLGLTHAFSIADDKGEPWIEYLKVADGQFIELFYAKPGFINQNTGYRHLCLEVDDCHAAAAELRARGVEVRSGPNQGKDHNWQCWIDDPDANPIEIMQIDPASPQANA